MQCLMKINHAVPDKNLAPLNVDIKAAKLVCFAREDKQPIKDYLWMLAKHKAPYAGDIQYQDNLSIAYLDDTLNLVSVLSGRNNLMLAPQYHQLESKAAFEQRVQTLLADFNCLDVADNLPAFMNNLEKRLLLILRGLMLLPQIFFMVKPFHGLEQVDYKVLNDCLLKLVLDRGITVVTCDTPLKFIEDNAQLVVSYQQGQFKYNTSI